MRVSQMCLMVPGNNPGARCLKMSQLEILKEFWEFLRVRKKWWLTPIIVVLLLLGFLITATQGSAVAPFIYTLF